MAYATGSDAALNPRRAETPYELKVVIAGGFGVGKTTLVGTLSEIEPLTTEEGLTIVGSTIDDLNGIADKNSTTVALDFGRITFHKPLPMILFLFGTPGQERFWFLWSDLSYGAIGAVVLVDTRRIQDSFTAVSWYEQQHMPFVVAVNEFDGACRYDADEVRHALALGPAVPIVTCDVRDSTSATDVLITLVGHALEQGRATPSGVSA